MTITKPFIVLVPRVLIASPIAFGVHKRKEITREQNGFVTRRNRTSITDKS
jgi:hypothetical protein